jgi:hypothetical protein
MSVVRRKWYRDRPEVLAFDRAMVAAHLACVETIATHRAELQGGKTQSHMSRKVRIGVAEEMNRVSRAADMVYETATAAAGLAYCLSVDSGVVTRVMPVGTLAAPVTRRSGFDARYDWGSDGIDVV